MSIRGLPGQAKERKLSSKQVSRSAYCPKHQNTLSNRFVGVNSKGWVFICKRDGGHDFVATPSTPAK